MVEKGNDLEEGNERTAGGGGGAPNQGIGLTVLQHHGGESVVLTQGVSRFLQYHSLGGSDMKKSFRQVFEFCAAGWVEETDTLQIQVQTRRVFFDHGAIAQQDGNAEAAGDPLPGGLENARVASFRKHDAFRMTLEFGGKAIEEGHKAGES